MTDEPLIILGSKYLIPCEGGGHAGNYLYDNIYACKMCMAYGHTNGIMWAHHRLDILQMIEDGIYDRD